MTFSMLLFNHKFDQIFVTDDGSGLPGSPGDALSQLHRKGRHDPLCNLNDVECRPHAQGLSGHSANAFPQRNRARTENRLPGSGRTFGHESDTGHPGAEMA
ncbi:hypothetical protein DESC_720308 [Desulfosarcina cetonica]|nr:hypothetical protein DESC_720308 [Desulfosarcina cetonica]